MPLRGLLALAVIAVVAAGCGGAEDEASKAPAPSLPAPQRNGELVVLAR